MASSLIHICIAKKINEKLNLDAKQLYLGSIAPDISKWSNVSKLKTHFSNENDPDIPNIDLFLKKYYNSLNDPFVLGYLTHLYVDKMWYEKFISSKFTNSKTKLLNGLSMKLSEEEWSAMMYHDFTALTKQITKLLNLDLTPLYENDYSLDYIVEEIPYEELENLTKKVAPLLINSTNDDCCLFNLEETIKFIDNCASDILEILKAQEIIS